MLDKESIINEPISVLHQNATHLIVCSVYGNTISKDMNMDVILGHIGQCGTWQILTFAIISLVAAAEAWVTLMYTFVAFVPKDYR